MDFMHVSPMMTKKSHKSPPPPPPPPPPPGSTPEYEYGPLEEQSSLYWKGYPVQWNLKQKNVHKYMCILYWILAFSSLANNMVATNPPPPPPLDLSDSLLNI